jgi:DNA invertase Pin-like site-specific DNA recombinase
MRVDGYVRVSKVDGRRGPSFISPKAQREEIEKWTGFRQAELLEVHVDLDQSGSRLDRPGLETALRRVESGLSDGIVVARLDRFSRSLTGALETIRRLDEAGALFVSVAEGLDPATPAGKMMMRLMLVMAEFELDRMREAFDDSRRRAVGRGVHPAGRLPHGYLRSEDGHLVRDPETADRIATCFRMRAERRSWAEVVAYAKESGAARPNDPSWSYGLFHRIMRNRVYVGEARSGAYRLPGAHEPIVERGIFGAVQVTQTATAQLAASRRSTLLAGLLRCSGCGRSLHSNADRRPSGETRPRYECRGGGIAGCCPEPVRVIGTEVEEVVQEAFFSIYGSSAIRRRASAASRRRAEADLVLAETRLTEFEWGHTGAEDQEKEREKDRELLAGRVETARRRVIDLARSTLIDSPARLRRRWAALPLGERRRLIGLVIDAALLGPDRGAGLADRLLLVPFGMGREGLPQTGHRTRLIPYEWARTAVAGPAVLGPEDPPPIFR